MSRVFTERSIRIAWGSGASYAEGFLRALQGQRIAYEEIPSPGASLIDLFLSLFGTSDPYLPAEVEIFHQWIASISDWGVAVRSTLGDSSKLHAITREFKAQWEPPTVRVDQILREQPGFFEPLPQDSPRIYLRNYHRKRL